MIKNSTITFLTLCLSVCLLMSGCGKDKEVPAPSPTPEENASASLSREELDALNQKNEEALKEDYNTIQDVSTRELKELRDKLMNAGNACQYVYDAADKGNAVNITLNRDELSEMIGAIAALGYPCVDYKQTLPMQAPEELMRFGESLSEDKCSTIFFNVFEDAHISLYNLRKEADRWFMITMSLQWKNGKPDIYSEGRYAVFDVQFTNKGWLIFNRNFSDFDDNQKSNSGSWVMIRVKPYDSTLKSLCDTYIKPIGYFENNLFTTNWSNENYGPIDFNSLYAYLFKMYTGKEELTSYNAYEYYANVQGTNLFLIPTGSFETVTQSYFDIGSDALRSISDYSSSRGGYYFIGYSYDYYNVIPRTPTPEVIDYYYNGDGSLSMVVDAVNSWYGTDRAFAHEVTIMPHSDGTFRYISNIMITGEESILPENRLSGQLNIELAKLK